MSIPVNRYTEAFQNLLRKVRRIGSYRLMLRDNHKFISAYPRREILGPEHSPYLLRDMD